MLVKKDSKENMLKEFLSLQLLYVEFTNYIENKIRNMLIENNIKYQAISSRVKSYDSLEKKLTDKIIDGIHGNIKRLNDLSGVRVIFYNEAELYQFNSLIYNCFKIEKYKVSDDITKYDGVNITISLDKKISKFNGMQCEIQLVTLLSHAINEFGHDIVYKDVNELKSKDVDEYNAIEDLFKKVRNDVLHIYANLEIINRRVQSIKNGFNNVELIINDNIINKLDDSKSFSEIEIIMQKMIDIIPLINKDPDKYKKIYEIGIIPKIVEKFSELPYEEDIFLNYNNFEYKYTKLLEFLQSYKYLWVDSFKIVLEKLYDISKNYDIVTRYDHFIENLLNSDKADSVRGFANYNIHEKVFSLITDNSINDHIRVKFAECYCDLNFNYCEEVSEDKVSFVNGKLKISEAYKQRIYDVISILLNMLLSKYTEELLIAIININYCLENNSDVFDKNPIYDFIYRHYNEINIYIKNRLYDSVCMKKESVFKKSGLYKKIKEDNIQMIYALLFNYHIEEPINGNYNEKNEYRISRLSNYINNFTEKDVDDFCLLLSSLNVADSNSINFYFGGNFLFKIGYETKYGEMIMDKQWNEFVLLGVAKSDKKYKYGDISIDKAIKVIKAMEITNEICENLLDDITELFDDSKNEEFEFELLKLIANNSILNIENKYKMYFLNKIEAYNNLSIGMIGKILVNSEAEKTIIHKYKKKEINLLLNNYRYCDFNQIDEFFLSDIFEMYPNSLRKLFRWKVINYPNKDLFNSYNFIDLSKCSNFNEELSNNLALCIEILKGNNHYYKSNYVHYLLGEYNSNIENAIISYINKSDNYDEYKAIVRICNIFDRSLSCWNIYETIIPKLDYDDKLLDEIDCNLFSGVCCGEDGLVNSFSEKYEFFKRLKTKNEKIKKFVVRERENYKILYCEEKNKLEKNRIIKNSK